MAVSIKDNEFTCPEVETGDYIQFKGGDIAIITIPDPSLTSYGVFNITRQSFSYMSRENDGSLATSEPYRVIDVELTIKGTAFAND